MNNDLQPYTNQEHLRIKLKPDRTTVSLLTLSRSACLPEQTVDASLVQKQAESKAVQLMAQKKHGADIKIKRAINQPKVATVPVFPQQQESNLAHLLDDVPIAQGFVRSERNLKSRAQTQLQQELIDSEAQKAQLHQRLASELIKLDKVNKMKRDLGEQLTSQIRFVKDLKKAIGDDELATNYDHHQDPDLLRQLKAEKQLKADFEKQLNHVQTEIEQLLQKLEKIPPTKDTLSKVCAVEQKADQLSCSLEAMRSECEAIVAQIEQLNQFSPCKRVDLDKASKEKSHIEQQLASLERAFGDTVAEAENHKAHTHRMHTKHLKLLAAILLSKSVSLTLLNHHKLNTLEKLRTHTKQQKGVDRITRLVVNRVIGRARDCLQVWYSESQQPAKSTKLVKAAKFFFCDSKRRFFYQWRVAYTTKRIVDTAMKSNLRLMQRIAHKSALRHQLVFFAAWKSQVSRPKQKLQTLRKFIRASYQRSLFCAFTVWRSKMTAQNIETRFAYLKNSLTQKQVTLRAWSELNSYRVRSKYEKKARKQRFLKNLAAAGKRSTVQKWVSQLMTKVGKANQEVASQEFWGILRFFKEAQKYKRSLNSLNSISKDIAALSETFTQLDTNHKRRLKFRAAMQTLFRVSLNKVAQLFDRWSQKVFKSKWKIRNLLLRLLLSKFEKSLIYGFYKWLEQKKSLTTQEHQTRQSYVLGQIFQNQQLITKANKEIHRTADVQLIRARTAVRHLVAHFCKSTQKRSLQQWNHQTKRLARGQYYATRLQTIHSKKVQSIFFTKWKSYAAFLHFKIKAQTTLQRKELQNTRLLLLTVFQALKAYSFRSTQHTICIESLLRKIDRHDLKATLKNWQQQTSQKTSQKLFEKQQSIVIQNADLIQHYGSLSDSLNAIEIESRTVQVTLRQAAQSTLKKWFYKFHEGGLRYGFAQWLRHCQAKNHQQAVLNRVWIQQHRHSVKCALYRWQFAAKQARVGLRAIEVKSRIGEAAQQEHALKARKQQHSTISAQMQTKLSTTVTQTAIRSQERVKTLSLICSKRLAFVEIPYKLYVLRQWHTYCQQTKQATQKLIRGLEKLLCHKGFTQVQNFSRRLLKCNSQNHSASKLLLLAKKSLTKQVINKWRQTIFTKTLQELKSVKTCLVREQAGHNKICSRELQIRQWLEVTSFRDAYLVRCFKLLKHQLQLSRSQRRKVIDMRWFEVKKALAKWKLRTGRTRFLRQRHDSIRKKTHRNLCSLAFAALQSGLCLQKALFTSLHLTIATVCTRQLISSFAALKQHSTSATAHNHHHKSRAVKQLASHLECACESRLQFAFAKLMEQKQRDSQQYLTLRTCVYRRVSLKLRAYFGRWAVQAHLLQVQKDEEHTGRMAVEAVWCRQQCTVLKQMVASDANDPHQAIPTKDLTKNYIMKMFYLQDSRVNLLPIYFDALKYYTRSQKKMKKITKNLAKHFSQKLLKYFCRWRSQNYCRKLLGKPILILKQHSCLVTDYVRTLTQQHHQATHKLKKVTEQRDFLFEGYLKAQKVALTLPHLHKQLVQQKCMLKMQDHTSNSQKSQLTAIIAANLDKISKLKSRIAELEDANCQQLASCNSLRKDSLQASQSYKVMHHLQQEVSQLSHRLCLEEQRIQTLRSDQLWLTELEKDYRTTGGWPDTSQNY